MKKNLFAYLLLFLLGYTSLCAQGFELLDTRDAGSGIESLIIGPDGNFITGHLDGTVILWDKATMKITKKVKDRSGLVYSILFNKDSTRFVTAGEGTTITVYEYPSFKIVQAFTVPCNENTFAAFSNDGTTVFYGGSDTDRGWDENTNTYREPYGALWRVKIGGTGKSEIAFNDEKPNSGGSRMTDGNVDYEGKYVVFCRSDELVFYDIENKRLGFKFPIKGILNNLTPTKDCIYVWGDKYLHRIEKENNRYVIKKTVLAGTRGGTYGYSKMVVSNNGRFLVTGDNQSFVNIRDPKTLDNIQELYGHTDLSHCFIFSDNDSILITGGYDGKLLVWGVPKPPKDTVPVITDVVFTENNIPVTIKDRVVELQSTIVVNQPEFDIEVWDQSMVDGDSISLNINGTWILQEYEVVKTKLTLHVKIDQLAANNYLILYAHNLGEFSPNTAAVQVIVGDKKYKLQLSSDLKKSGALNFSYQPK